MYCPGGAGLLTIQTFGASGIWVELETKIKPSEVEEYCHPEPFPIPESTRHALDTLNA
jgi:hypothetical protein